MLRVFVVSCPSESTGKVLLSAFLVVQLCLTNYLKYTVIDAVHQKVDDIFETHLSVLHLPDIILF